MVTSVTKRLEENARVGKFSHIVLTKFALLQFYTSHTLILDHCKSAKND